jgi:hypothetical protein
MAQRPGFPSKRPRRRSPGRSTTERPVFIRKPERAQSFPVRRSNRQQLENGFSGAASTVQSRGSQPPNGRRTAAPVLRGRPAARRRRAAWRSSGFLSATVAAGISSGAAVLPSNLPGGDLPPVRSPAAGGFHRISAVTVLLPSNVQAPGVSPAGSAAIPSRSAAGRGGLRRRSRRCLVSGAGRRPVHPAAGGCPSSVRTDDGAASGGASRRPELPTLRRQRRLSLSLSLFLSRRRELVIGVTNSRFNEGFFDKKCAPSPGQFGHPLPRGGEGNADATRLKCQDNRQRQFSAVYRFSRTDVELPRQAEVVPIVMGDIREGENDGF